MTQTGETGSYQTLSKVRDRAEALLDSAVEAGKATADITFPSGVSMQELLTERVKIIRYGGGLTLDVSVNYGDPERPLDFRVEWVEKLRLCPPIVLINRWPNSSSGQYEEVMPTYHPLVAEVIGGVLSPTPVSSN